ncbi:MAG TPA: alpha glucosidase [Alphaproteobacteria bacterium]|nr:alpha glucosidase [Alphaproteobacteria bacterium]
MSDPDWWRGAVFYQIYPRSFMDLNGDGVGDLPGITDRLEHIANLGIDAIWISPFFKSPMADFGYDVSDYRCVDPMFGTNEDFDILLSRAHDLGLKVIVDLVLSHTSTEHPWFIESRLSANNRKADWYVWADAKPDGSPPNNWQSVFSGDAWTFDTKRGQYYLHNFLREQPDLNFHNPAVQDQVLSECRYWLERGVDGFRLDVCNFYFHDKELRDNPPRHHDETISTGVQFEKPYPYIMQRHIHDKSQPENLEFLGRLRKLMDEYPDKMTLGEIGDDDPYKLSVEYTKGDDYLNTTYNTHFIAGTDSKILTKEMIQEPVEFLQNYSKEVWPSWAFGNHDVVRPVTRWGKSIKDKDAFAKLLMKMLLCLRGTIFIYQGEELGLSEAHIRFEDIQDPWGKALWPEWQGRDGCRTPIPWQADLPQAGFSESHKTWLPIPHEHVIRAVNTQETDPHSVLNTTREFIAWRKQHPALIKGSIDFFETNNPFVLGFVRQADTEKMRCLFNLSEQKQSCDGFDLLPLEARIEKI